MLSPRRRRAAAHAVALLVVPLSWLGATSAVAGLKATATGTGAASSASWSVVATTSSAAPYGSGPLALSFRKAAKAAPPAYVNLVNTGSVTTRQAQYALSVTPLQDVVLEGCTGTWDERRDTCSGTVVLLTTALLPTTSTFVPSAPGSQLRVRVRLTSATPPDSTVVLDVRTSNLLL